MAKCNVCKTESKTKFKKIVNYWKCNGCGAIFCKSIPKETIKIHNDNPEQRNSEAQNATRLLRIAQHSTKKPEKILDFGCGSGDFVKFLYTKQIKSFGIDRDTSLTLDDITDDSLDAIVIVETIEHLYNPMEIFVEFGKKLMKTGVIYIESSFVDYIDPQGSYVDPEIGHCCIHSVKSIDYIAQQINMKTHWLNNNVVIMK